MEYQEARLKIAARHAFVNRRRSKKAAGASKVSIGRFAAARAAIRIEFGGFDSSASPERHLSWHQQELKVGDVVSIRVLGGGLIDEPN